jgi:hypothetical protein
MKYILLTVLFLSPCILFSKKDIEPDSFPNSFGAKFSNISGYGFSYNRQLTEKLQIQFTALTYYYFSNNNNEKDNNFNYDFGVEIQRNFYKEEDLRFYILAGAFYYYDDDKKDGKNTKNYITKNSFNFGIGLGVEMRYYRFIFGADAGYKFYYDKMEITDNLQHYPQEKLLTKIGGAISIGFLF